MTLSASQDTAVKKRVIYIAPLPPPYMGPSVATDVLFKSRFTEEFKVDHLDTSDHRPLDTLGRMDFMNIYLALKHYVQLLWKLVTTCADVVYVPISQSPVGYLRDIPFIVMPYLFGKKIILHLRGGYFREFYNSSGAIMRFLIRRTLGMADRMIVLGESLRPLFEGLMPPDSISVVPNGCDLPELAAEIPNKGGQFQVLFLSNLIREKGYRDVLISACDVAGIRKDIRFVFAGAWMSRADKDDGETLVESAGLRDRIVFMGSVSGEAKIRLLLESDLFVFPTYYPFEGHPWSIVEAMAAGLPIISTDHAAISESVIHNANGFLIEKKNHKQISQCILKLLDDRKMLEEMGVQSREIYLKKFTSRHFTENMIRVFNEVIEG